ncbi:MAG: DUF3575 domain-containing protein [Bacteroidales bacterium]
MKIRFLLILLLLNLSKSIFCIDHSSYLPGEISPEQIKIKFRLNSKQLDKHYINNEYSIKSIENIFRTNYPLKIDSIIIVATSSPDGSYAYNKQLSEKRANQVKEYILSLNQSANQLIIKAEGKGEGWDELNRYVESDLHIPYKKEVQYILSQIADPSLKELKLKKIMSQNAWNYLKETYFADLRNGQINIYYNLCQYLPPEIKPFKDFKDCLPSVTNILADYTTKVYSSHDKTNTVTSGLKPLFSLKTNLLADAATFINVEIEVPIGKNWSVGAEWMFPWWIFNNNKYYNQILLGTLEGRYWFHTKKQQEVLSGHAIGLYASAGYYDFQWKKKGYQGEIQPSVGLSYTYAHKIGKQFRMEYSLGMGVLNTKYRKYTANDQYNQFPWLSSGRTIWIGPTKAEISFVWLISKRIHNEKK